MFFKKRKYLKEKEELEIENQKLKETILRISAQLKNSNIRNKYLKEENERLSWTITNGKGY
jgi:hypothetical protein|tara:strand:+ start:287 stop:469 length:183 start_codon:yes stop_codon:yes gene_type:complete